MRLKRIIALFVCTLLLAGCAVKGPDTDKLNELTQNDLTEEKMEVTPTELPQEVSGQENETKDSAEEEKEPYILNFEANTIDGEAWNSDKLADSRLTMINVWATYCNPCLSEMPDLGEIASEYDSAEFQLIGIISDVMEGDSEENISYAKQLIEETTATYPHLLLNESLYGNLVGAVSGVPTTFFVNDKSELLGYVVGAQSKDNWKELIDRLLAEME